LPGNPIAAGLYDKGLLALKQFQPAVARRELESALMLEPRQPLLYAALAKAFHALQADEKERQVARVAFELSTDLDQQTRLDIEASYRESVHEWAAAAKLRSALATFYPENLDYGLALVEAQRRATQTDDALATIARLRRLAPPDGDDPRLDVAEAQLRATADPAAAYRLLDRAIIGALGRGASGVEADAHLLVCSMKGIALQPDAAAKQCNAALAIYEAEHDLTGQASVYAKLAGLNITARRPAEIEKYASRAQELYKQVGSRSGELGVKAIFALAYRRSGDNVTAEKLWREAVAGYREAGEVHLMIKAMDDLASTLTDEGKQDEATPLYREVIRVAHDNGLTSIEANSLSNFSITLTTRGELVEAAQLAADAVAKWKQLGQLNDAVFGMDSMGQIALRQGRLADSRAIENEALATREKLGWVGGPSRQNLANIDLEEAHYARAVALARKAVDEFHTSHEPRSELYAHDILIRALVEGGELDEADAAAKRMSELSKQVGAARISTTGAFSLLRAARGDVPGALAMLRDALVEDRRGGDVDDELDHLGLVAEILVKHGAPADARKALAEVRAQAIAHGYTQTVHDADALQRRLQ
jgi:tetratricopeptide (TPR) repeat protein